jgi:diaminohydroxyphosphoribosylaminopyrimidine deaminase/5-amino-6-(5-phosphoribosylamino)uracil reductase
MSLAGKKSTHELMMAECLRLAAKGRGHVSPNPLVGALLAQNGKVLARGYHKRFGGPHAEVECLRKYKGDVSAATLYVNLEPCCHYGKTPPCTDLIIRSGIRRVVVGMKDPNPAVAGRGIRKLKTAGITVMTGILEGQAQDLNREFTRHITSGIPYVHMKVAETLDGKIAGDKGTVHISSRESRRWVHRLRSYHDAVLVGAGTVRADDPLLTTRMVTGRNPDVVVLDGNLSTPANARVYKRLRGRRVFVFVGTTAAARKQGKVRLLAAKGVRVLTLRSENGVFPVRDVLSALNKYDIGSVLVEGGAEVFSRFLYDGLVDEISLFVAPRIMGSGKPAFLSDRLFMRRRRPGNARNFRIQVVGSDVLLHARIGQSRR